MLHLLLTEIATEKNRQVPALSLHQISHYLPLSPGPRLLSHCLSTPDTHPQLLPSLCLLSLGLTHFLIFGEAQDKMSTRMLV